jgi:hypothetical protein
VLAHQTLLLKIFNFEVSIEFNLIASNNFDIFLFYLHVVIVGFLVEIRGINAVC